MLFFVAHGGGTIARANATTRLSTLTLQGTFKFIVVVDSKWPLGSSLTLFCDPMLTLFLLPRVVECLGDISTRNVHALAPR